jgi:hypothetical protein
MNQVVIIIKAVYVVVFVVGDSLQPFDAGIKQHFWSMLLLAKRIQANKRAAVLPILIT